MGINWETTLQDAALELGGQILVAIKESIEDWDEIDEPNKAELESLSMVMGQLKIREIMGEDVSDLVGHVNAQVSNLKFVNDSIKARINEAFWEKVLLISGSIIFGIAKKAVGI